MKSIIFSFLATLALSASAQSKPITIVTNSGEVDFAVSEISDLVFGDDGHLDINLTNQSTSTFSADEFVAIRFSKINGSSGVKPVITSEADVRADVFSISGQIVARGVNISDARASLQPGVYIVKSSNGSTSKILVK